LVVAGSKLGTDKMRPISDFVESLDRVGPSLLPKGEGILVFSVKLFCDQPGYRAVNVENLHGSGYGLFQLGMTCLVQVLSQAVYNVGH